MVPYSSNTIHPFHHLNPYGGLTPVNQRKIIYGKIDTKF
jgi:hypothetical protein